MSVLTHHTRGRTDRTTGSLAWLLVLGIVLAAMNLRTAVTSVGPVLDQVSSSLGMTGVGVGLLTTLPVLIFASVGALTPAMARRVGEHRLLLFALIVLGAGLLIRSMVDSAEVFLYSSALALSGGAVGNVLIPSLIKRHFPGRAGTMTTVYTTALAVGTMLAAAATVPIERAADGNWHVALGVWAALAAVAAVPWLALARTEPERRTVNGQVGARALVRSRLAWAVAAYFGTQSMVAYIMFGFLPKILIDGGYSTGQAGLVLGVFTAIGIPVSLVVPWIAAKFADQRPVVAAFVAFYVAGFLGLWLMPSGPAWLFAVLVGIGMGSFPLALTILAMRTRTPEATAALSAFGQSVGYLIAGAGPLLIGVMYEATGGWTLPFLLLFAVVGVQFATGWYAARPGYLEDEGAVAR
ncbi:CP family cyanate transporter-like MFS transporter [Streptosporangium becharense]|uniref:CP family cyanate transporter-like MFS transporter n=1 Tax=Streptosporangium becharense TaxID=1816182 RepID=A0A7W9MJ29_9ACTN|nr:MFS transporter [Streptosporangium becharense]MBB2913106.1 CP family cyanate transporter-like MFS transporter [Streptosporangium becharense]MBB5822089.1 CP family cyanate transporter-like MFS transporter [Streptosporangium becharense]